jgi:acetylornithine/N-succinyldiaminopimelate aminotransferase
MGGASRPDLTFVAGEGSYLTDDTGRTYLDFVSGWAVNSLGHCAAEIREALARQAGELIHCAPGYWNRPAMALAQRLGALTGMERVFLGCTGAEANECALKLARLHGKACRNGAFKVLTAQEGFHGRTLATMAATGKDAWRGLFGPELTGFVHLPLGDLEAFEAAAAPDVCAVMLEPVQGESGVHPASPGFLQGLRSLCDREGILLILDEVQTGIGRTGHWTCAQSLGIRPDILTLGKGLGGGIPLSACLCRQEVDRFQPGDQGGTFTYHPLSSAAGLAVLEAIERRDLLGNVRRQGGRLREILEGMAGGFALAGLRGCGLLQAFDLPARNAKRLVELAREEGLLLNAPRPSTIRLMPDLTLSDVDLECFATRLRASLSRLTGEGASATRP